MEGVTDSTAPRTANDPTAHDSWHRLTRVGFDLETTGRDPHQARIVTASLVLVDDAGTARADAEWLLNPGVEIPAEAAAVHGVTTERARAEGMDARTGVEEIADTLRDFMEQGLPVVAYNGVYDFTVLAAELARHGLDPMEVTGVIDPFVIDKKVDTYRKGQRTLTHVCEHYGVTLDDAHTSAADCLAAVGVADALAVKYPKLQMPLAQLHALQVQWKAEQSASFQGYLRRSKDPQAVISSAWPVEPVN